MQLSFESIFAKAIAEWPASVKLTKFWDNLAKPELYAVAELYELQERLSASHTGSEEELLMACMHWAINVALHGVARGQEIVQMTTLSPIYVRVRFDNDVRNCVNDAHWAKPTVALARAYLAHSAQS